MFNIQNNNLLTYIHFDDLHICLSLSDRSCISDIELPPPPAMLGEQMSASSCRRVHSEILESVSKIKCSLLGRKGGLLHSYGNYGSEIALNELVGGSSKYP